jgi:hypothetical protein
MKIMLVRMRFGSTWGYVLFEQGKHEKAKEYYKLVKHFYNGFYNVMT